MDDALDRAAEALRRADALLVTAGAGMGVDSGLPDFRGPEGFWRAYPAYRHLGLSFPSLADPRWFREDPPLAWGFYGHRLALYRATRPHDGFAVLLRWAQRMAEGAFVFTSNVDGQFQRAGVDDAAVVECHGSLMHAQCTAGCGLGVVPADPIDVRVDPETFRAEPPLPGCPRCGALLRPNVLMFRDGDWDGARTAAQEARFAAWRARLRARRSRLVIVECGAGTGVPTVRLEGEAIARALGAPLVRINVREPEGPPGTIGVPWRASAALAALDAAMAAG
jgi:NAD-dependent SIR2 family protein deacetylase